MLEEQISKDYIEAMKAKDTIRSSTLSFLRSQLKYVVIEKKVEKLADTDVIAVIKKQIKQRQDSIEQFQKGGRMDLVEKETKELNILQSYLPPEMPLEQIQTFIDEAVKETQAASIKDMGKVMKAVLVKVAGQADSKTVSDLVKNRMNQI